MYPYLPILTILILGVLVFTVGMAFALRERKEHRAGQDPHARKD
jgi:hypothetical protein